MSSLVLHGYFLMIYFKNETIYSAVAVMTTICGHIDHGSLGLMEPPFKERRKNGILIAWG